MGGLLILLLVGVRHDDAEPKQDRKNQNQINAHVYRRNSWKLSS